MAAANLRFYLDENLPVEIARQLRVRNIDAVTARDLGRLGDSDVNHLERATELERVLCTYDTDYVRLAAEGFQHTGIVLGHQATDYIGTWVNYLELIHTVYTPEEMANYVEYL